MASATRRNSQHAFTLIELMIVIAIIAILAAILIPNFVRARARGQLTGCQENLKNISTAIEMYNNDWTNYPNVLTDLTPNYLPIIPICESAQAATYKNGYASVGTWYTVVCEGLNHSGAGVNSANYPQYNAYSGLTMP